MRKNGWLALLLALCIMALPVGASAHGVWFAQRSDRTQLVCGEGWKDSAYDPDGLVEMRGFDAQYGEAAVEPLRGEDYLYIEPGDDVRAVYVEFDYGYWSKTPAGEWLPRPMDEVEGATMGTHAVKYSVNYLGSVEAVRAIDGAAYQLVPDVDPTTLTVGQSFTVRLLHEGEPMPGVEIIPDVLNHHTRTVTTDETGAATVTAANGGLNVIGCEMTVPYENQGVDEKATQSKAFVSLSFTLYPAEDD